MTWWAWILLWVALLAGAVTLLFFIVRSLWRKVVALVAELGVATERLSVVTAELNALTGTQTAQEPAVFADPSTLRQQRYLAARKKRRRT